MTSRSSTTHHHDNQLRTWSSSDATKNLKRAPSLAQPPLLSAWHTTRTRYDPRTATARITAPPCPSHTRRTRGTGRSGAYEAGFVFRVVVVASSSARPVGCSGITRNTATTRKRSAPPRNATNSDLKSSASGLFGTCLVAVFHCDATAGRPGGCGHFSCLGCFSTTIGEATNQHRSRVQGTSPGSSWTQPPGPPSFPPPTHPSPFFCSTPSVGGPRSRSWQRVTLACV